MRTPTLEDRIYSLEFWLRLLRWWALAVSAIFLWSATAHCEERSKTHVWISPDMALKGVHPVVHIITRDPELTCPRVEILWAEGNRSLWDSDCDPEDLPESFSWEKRSPVGFPGGRWTILVILSQGGKRALKIPLYIEVVE